MPQIRSKQSPDASTTRTQLLQHSSQLPPYTATRSGRAREVHPPLPQIRCAAAVPPDLIVGSIMTATCPAVSFLSLAGRNGKMK
ncbi:excinuclease ABC subunit B [Sesbania bispinosa]|nr:excinuclease ABC subunit B [Sesbania bispinosa]